MSTLALHLNKPYGYSCQTWLATDIANRYFSRVYRVWFATTLNPRNNGHSSNPVILYQELDIIVHHNDFNHSRVDQLRQRLTNWVSGSPLSPTDIADLRAEITSAPVAAFRPQLWRINLANIHITRLVNLGQFPDEYQIRDLIAPEFEVIAE
jgi:hypothetical protein